MKTFVNKTAPGIFSLLCAVSAFTIHLPAQAGPSAAIVQNISRNVMLATYQDLATQARRLQQSIDALAVTRNQENLDKAQAAWKATRVPWEASEAFLFGPVDSLGIDPLIDTWPLNKIDLDGVLNSGRPLTVDFVRNLGANLQGFHTLEYLLFGDGKITNKKQISQLTQRELDYLRAVSALLSENTARLFDAWARNANPDDASVPGFVDIIGKPGFDNPSYSSEQAVLAEYTQGILAILDEVANGKMSDPLGADIGSANVALVESPFSWNSLTDFTYNIYSVLNVYTGSYNGARGPGLKDFVARHNSGLAQDVENRIRHAITTVQAVAGPQNQDYRFSILDPAGRERAKAAINELNQLRAYLETHVLPLVQ